MNNFEKRLRSIQERLNKATPWSADDDRPATEEWRNNLSANADLCRNAYSDLKALHAIVKLQNSVINNVDGLLSDDYFENWEECLTEIENLNIDIRNIVEKEK